MAKDDQHEKHNKIISYIESVDFLLGNVWLLRHQRESCNIC